MYHSVVDSELALQVVPHTVWKKIFNVLPPIIIRLTQVPPARYRVGNRANIFPNLSPGKKKKMQKQIKTGNLHLNCED